MWPAMPALESLPHLTHQAQRGRAQRKSDFVNSQNLIPYGRRQCVQFRRPLSVNSPESVFRQSQK